MQQLIEPDTLSQITIKRFSLPVENIEIYTSTSRQHNIYWGYFQV